MSKPHSLMPPKKAGSSDIFGTPVEEIHRMLPFLPKDWRIWENASGDGRIVKTLKEQGYDVIGTDIMSGFDFLSPLVPPPEFDCIFTNPPYSIKDNWLERCFDLGKPFALLMPITAMGEQKRVSMYKKYGIQLALPPGRINFDTPSGQGTGSWFYAAWICHGLPLPSQIHVLD